MAEIKQEIKKVSESDLQSMNLVMPKNFSDKVYNTLATYEQNGRLNFPQNYNVGNAVTSAYLTIQQDSKLKTCDNASVVQSMIDMAVMGLNPSRKQCYFIPMGNKCTLMVSYFGKQSALKRIKGVIDVRSDVIYEGTEYELFADEYGNDDIKIVKPCPLKDRKNDKIEGAWCRIVLDENVWGTSSYVAIMTIEDIKNAHSMGASKGNSKAHNNFMNEMAKKSVINRCIKNFVNTQLDDDLLADTFVRSEENEYKGEDIQQEYYEKKVVNVDDLVSDTSKPKENKKEKEVIDVEAVEQPQVEVIEKQKIKKEDVIDVEVDFGDIEF